MASPPSFQGIPANRLSLGGPEQHPCMVPAMARSVERGAGASEPDAATLPEQRDTEQSPLHAKSACWFGCQTPLNPK